MLGECNSDHKSKSREETGVELQNIIISMPDRSQPGIPTTAYAIGKLQDGYDKLDTGSNNNNNIIQRTHNNKQLSTSTKRRINLPKNITTIGTWNVRTLRGIGKVQELTI